MSLRAARPVLGLAFLVVLTAWPPIHMALARSSGFAPSRLGGWGMYAAPDESFTGVEMFVVAPGAELPAGVLGEDSPHRPDGVRFTFEVHLTVVAPEGMHPFDGSEIDAEQLAALWRDIQRVQAFPTRGSASRLAERLRRLQLSPHDPAAVLIVLATPGVDLAAGHGFVDVRAFVSAEGELETIEARVAGRPALERLEERLRREVAEAGS